MPNIKVERIESFSSEAKEHPAENLLHDVVSRKWTCKNPGEPVATIILKLEEKSIISGIDIGNANSAFVEVLAKDSHHDGSDFDVLLTASSFMSPMESRNGTKPNRVRFFTDDQFLSSNSKNEYDLIKIVCTQPFNKYVQYGLSFFVLHTPRIKADKPITPKLGHALMKSVEQDEPISVGSLFARHIQTSSALTGTSASAIRDASSSFLNQSNAFKANLTSGFSKEEKKQTLNEMKMKKMFGRDEILANLEQQKNGKDDRPITKARAQDNRSPFDESKITKKRESPGNSNAKLPRTPKLEIYDSKATPSAKKAKVNMINKPALKKPFNKLLEGVVIVISGYQNPTRGYLRSKVLEMGGKYKPGWDSSSTHLICAFRNTPKFQQVIGKGHIIRKEWIDDCHKNRKRLPWRRYALDKKEKDKEESEEEILEEVLDRGQDSDSDFEVSFARLRAAQISSSAQQYSDSDTEDEIERVNAATNAVGGSFMEDDDELYGGNTDEDDKDGAVGDERSELDDLPLPHLLDIFDKKTFYLNCNISLEKQKHLLRYITAYKGKISSVLDQHVDYVLSKNDNTIWKLKAVYPNVDFIMPEWVWKCHEAEKLLSPTSYLIG